MKKKIVVAIGIIGIILIVVGSILQKQNLVNNKSSKKRNLNNSSYNKNDVESCEMCKIDENGNRVNISPGISAEYEVSNLIISNIEISSLKENPTNANIKFKITNKTGKLLQNIMIKMYFFDQKSELINMISFPVEKFDIDKELTIDKSVEARVIDSFLVKFNIDGIDEEIDTNDN